MHRLKPSSTIAASLLLTALAGAEPFDQKLYDAKARIYSPEESMAMIEMQASVERQCCSNG